VFLDESASRLTGSVERVRRIVLSAILREFDVPDDACPDELLELLAGRRLILFIVTVYRRFADPFRRTTRTDLRNQYQMIKSATGVFF
jgi:hypothetical protein